jgi:SAM-dependent methyltransferase
MERKAHWDGVYAKLSDERMSWFQPSPQRSLELILNASGGHGRVLDVGGGTSLLVDRLLEYPFDRVAVLDISAVALVRARARLGVRAEQVQWIEGDITADPPLGEFDIWHDRAVFHFLTDANDRERYVALAGRTLSVGGHMVIATFGPEGPTRCSGLEVCRYDARSLAEQLGTGFALTRQESERHFTPSGRPQDFLYAVFRLV